MATRKYLSLTRLEEYDELIKAKISSDDSAVLESAKDYTDDAIEASKTYVDNAMSQKSQVQFVVWGADD